MTPVGPEAMTGEASPVRGGLALLDPLLGRPALIVEADDGPVGPRERRGDEVHPGKQLEPPRAAFLTGATRLWSGPVVSQNENAG